MNQEKKKSKTLLYLLGGCAALLFLIALSIILIFAFFGSKIKSIFSNPEEVITKAIISSNPHIEVVSIDKENKKITIKNKKTGETITIDFSEAIKGRIKWKGKDEGSEKKIEISDKKGEGKLEISEGDKKTTITYGFEEDLPPWIPELKGFKILNKIKTTQEEQISGIIEFETQKSLEDSIEDLKNSFTEKGFELKTTISGEGEKGKFSMFQGSKDGEKYKIFINLNYEKGKTKGSISYSEKK